MKLTKHLTGQTLTVGLQGELDHHSAEEIRQCLDREIESSGCMCLTLDLSGVTFMDSSGLGVILGRYRLLNARGGTLFISGAQSSVERILRMSGLYSLIRKVEKA